MDIYDDTQIRYRALHITNEEIDEFLQHSSVRAVEMRELARKTTKYYSSDEVYLDLMRDILSGYPHLGVPQHPTEIFPHFFIGTEADAQTPMILQQYGVTNVLFVEAYRNEIPAKNFHPLVLPINEYAELGCKDREKYDITKDFGPAFGYLHDAKQLRGRVLAYGKGVSCSGALAIGYMVYCGIPLLEATRKLKDARRNVLNNEGFMEHLVKYARQRSMLDAKPGNIKVVKYGGALDRHRLHRSHLPLNLA